MPRSGSRGTDVHDSVGHTLLSGSDDTRLGVWDVDTKKLKSALRTGHRANIFCTRYMPGTGPKLPIRILRSLFPVTAMGAPLQLLQTCK